MRDGSEQMPMMQVTTTAFLGVEHFIYIALGAILAIAAVLALGSAAAATWSALGQWPGVEGIITAVDRLLFALMVVEILHTVRMSVRSGVLTGEPFLVVGLIASIRRVLVITLESSRANQGTMNAPGAEAFFRSTMIELGVLGGLIMIMVVALFLLHRSGKVASTDPPTE